MNQWSLSRYTSVIKCDSGDILLYNSFMGAIARIPAHQSMSIERSLQQDVIEPDIDNHALKELYDGGFLVSSNIAERELVSDILEKERKLAFSILILPHENCNFRCLYCYEKFERGKMKKDVIAGLKALVDHKAREYKRISVGWFGGEPLLAKDVIYELSDSFVNSCEHNDITYTSSMTTNGYYLTPDVVDDLLCREIKYFQVTLDGPEAAHNAMRKLSNGKGTYRRILNNLIQMRNRDDEFSVKIRVNFNGASISFMEEWLSNEIVPLFANDHRFSLMFHPVSKWGGSGDATLDVCEEGLVSRINQELIEKSLTFGFSDEVAKESLKPHGNVCYAGKESSIVVGSDGVIYKCTVAFDDIRNQVGRLTTEGELVIDRERWNLWVTVDDKITRWCTSCSFYPNCQSKKCPMIALNQKRPPCPMTKKEYESLVKLVVFSKR